MELEIISQSYDDTKTKITTSVTGGNADIAYLDVVWPGEFADKGLILPLTDYFTDEIKSGIMEGNLQQMTVGDDSYGMPFCNNGMFMFYNKAMLEEAGYTEPPTTWDELKEMSQAMQEKGICKYGIAWPGQQAEGSVCNLSMMLYSFGGTWTEGDEFTFNSDAGVQAVQFMVDSINDGWADPSSVSYSDRDIIDMIRAIHCRGGKAIVRIYDKSRAAIGRILDMGADGIIAPQVSTYEEALEVVKATKYPPVGNRGFCPITPGVGYGLDATPAELAVRANENTVVGLMVETKGCVEELDKILSIKELDYAAIGPSDLSASYGLPGENDAPVVKKAIEEATEKIKASHVALFGQCYKEEDVAAELASGASVLNVGSDLQFLVWGFSAYVKAVKGSVNE